MRTEPMTPKKDLELYLHIPFCRQKCRYCDFFRSGTAGSRQLYSGWLRSGSIRRCPPFTDRAGESVLSRAQSHYDFLGRRYAVPLRVMDMERLMDAIRAHFCVADDAEITLESNPGTLDFEKTRRISACRNQPAEHGAAVGV